MGKVLNLNTNLILGNDKGVRPLSSGHYSLDFHCFLSNCRSATFHSEVKNCRHRVFLEYKLTKIERGFQQTRYYKILFEAVFGKVFYTNA